MRQRVIHVLVTVESLVALGGIVAGGAGVSTWLVVPEIVWVAVICSIPVVLGFVPWVLRLRASRQAPEASLPAVIDQQAPRPIDPKDWEGVAGFTLEQAACLWVRVEPHSPISDMRASATLAKLQGAAVLGQLECNPNGLMLLSAALAGSRWRPAPSHFLTAVALKRYADVIGDVPAFLQAVSVPEPSQQPSEGSQDDQ